MDLITCRITISKTVEVQILEHRYRKFRRAADGYDEGERTLDEMRSIVGIDGCDVDIVPATNNAGQRQAPAQSQKPTENQTT